MSLSQKASKMSQELINLILIERRLKKLLLMWSQLSSNKASSIFSSSLKLESTKAAFWKYTSHPTSSLTNESTTQKQKF